MLLAAGDVRCAEADVDTTAGVSQPTTAAFVRQLEPLSIRGVNYYPSKTSWGEFWSSTPPEVIERDMALAASLHVNTVRIFIDWGTGVEQHGLIDRDGNVSPEYLKRFESFLAAAWKHGIRVIPCFELERRTPEPAVRPKEHWQRAMRAFVEPHVTDGRILMWDLMNEPERHGWSAGTRQYLQDAVEFIKALDRKHLVTVGIAYQVDKLSEVMLPDVLQYHEYSSRAELEELGPARVSRSIRNMLASGGARPVFIGEFGISSGKDPVHGADQEWIRTAGAESKAETEAQQLWRYEQILKAAEEERIAGVLAWCLHEYPTTKSGWLTPTESQFGLVRLDGSLKPAAEFLRQKFEAWEQGQVEPSQLVSSNVMRSPAGMPGRVVRRWPTDETSRIPAIREIPHSLREHQKRSLAGGHPYYLSVDAAGRLQQCGSDDSVTSFVASGDCIYADKELTVNADQMVYSAKEGKIFASGEVVFRYGGKFVGRCKLLTYDPKTGEGKLRGEPIIFNADKNGRVSSTQGVGIVMVSNDGKVEFKVHGGPITSGASRRLPE